MNGQRSSGTFRHALRVFVGLEQHDQQVAPDPHSDRPAGMPSKNRMRRASERCAADICGICVSVIGVDIDGLL